MLYVGIDVHRKSSQLAVVNDAGELVRSRRVRSRPEEVWRVFGELPGEESVEAVFEATFGYGWLADLLADAGIRAHMAHPLATKAIAAGQVKNDKVDAAMLAQLLRANLLPEGVCEVVRCRVWLGQTKGAMIDGGSTVRRACSALLPG